MRKVIYTTIFEERDIPRKVIGDYNDCLLFTDKADSLDWKVIDCKRMFISPRVESRVYKMMPHKFFESEYSLFIDANIDLNVDIDYLIRNHMDGKDIAFFRHNNWDCTYDQTKSCIRNGLGYTKTMTEQMAHYREKGLPEHAGCMAGCFILRKHTPKVARFNEFWWSEYCRWPDRDQCSLMYSLIESGLDVNVIGLDINNNELMKRNPHANQTV